MLILPATIQLVHAFEQHEHVVCTSEVEQHIHENDLECALCHLQAQNHAIDFHKETEVIPPQFYTTNQEQTTSKYIPVVLHQKSSRAPPYFTISNC